MAESHPVVKDFMTPDPITISPTDSIEKVIKLIEDHRISGMPVVDASNHVVGIISEGDLLVRESPMQPPLYMTLLGSVIYFESPKQFHQHMQKALGMLVQDVMTSQPITTKPDIPLTSAANLMLSKKINRLPVVDNDQYLIGIITRHDLVRALKPAVTYESLPD
ncbi:CBS domain-containing protein [Acaryochloris sp. CCMEE 5410]|uniref:CBS domain-containing protein n=1 Tax=Acaryochloris sp. CCMEE 5410 TaxID=310037 RepID=UPI0002484D96|nr:CBS domain-containing protein [Acaryochloris sp. CCMEE 5410]KAI9130266.1 CBS domain-containing protein [Acaryochloris sp. CCMEE 5410]